MSQPPDARLSREWADLASQVRRSAPEWVPVKRNVWPNVAYRIRNGAVVAFRPASSFEVTARRPERPEPGQPHALVDVWVRSVEGGDS